MQLVLKLEGGHHAGPLFVAAKRRGAKVSIRSSARWRFLRRRIPPWADRSVLYALRRLVVIYWRETGVAWSQDHIVPLQHPLVCGLHCESNIAIMTCEDNLRKGNRWWPDMPEVQLELEL